MRPQAESRKTGLFLAPFVLGNRAFQESIGWGLASIFIPFAQTAFGICHWSRAKYSFLGMHIPIVAIVYLMVSGGIPLSEEGFTSALTGSASPLAGYDAQDLTSMIQEKRSHIEKLEGHFHALSTELTTEFAALNKKRTTLKANDATAVAQFNAEAAAYDSKNTAHKSTAKELETARKELQELLDERSRRPANRDGKK